MRPEHLRDEMREHFRLRKHGVLTAEEYEASKARILAEHSPASAGPRDSHRIWEEGGIEVSRCKLPAIAGRRCFTLTQRVAFVSPTRDLCPCGSTRPYTECCGPWHTGAPAPDALSLMRSRYSAFVLCNEQYLLATWHSSTRPASVPFNKKQKWLGLRIVDTRVTGDASAEVEFVARSRASDAAAVRLHERSRFVREDGRWFYVEGDLLGG